MTDRIVLTDMRFEAAHGFHAWERERPQRFEVDVELAMDLQPAGTTDDLTRTVDYGRVYDAVAEIVTTRSFHLLEAIAEAIAARLLDDERGADEVVVRVRKPDVVLGGPLGHAAVEIRRPRPGVDVSPGAGAG
jgi:dihydroneopterin aldolase